MENFWSIAANQGFSVLLLAVAVFYFYQRQKSWEAKIEDLHNKRDSEREEFHKKRDSEREQMFQLTEELKLIIIQNTQILESIKGILNDRSKIRA